MSDASRAVKRQNYERTWRRGERVPHDCLGLGELTVALGGEAHDEHPPTARSWPLVRRFRRVAQYGARLDGCSVGSHVFSWVLMLLRAFVRTSSETSAFDNYHSEDSRDSGSRKIEFSSKSATLLYQ